MTPPPATRPAGAGHTISVVTIIVARITTDVMDPVPRRSFPPPALYARAPAIRIRTDSRAEEALAR